MTIRSRLSAPVAISLFSGAGGLDLGISAAGYRVAAAVEIDHDAAKTLELNFPELHGSVIRDDITQVSTREILEVAGLSRRDRPDLLVGGPPCTPFSKSGFWLEYKRKGLDPRASLLQEYTRVLREAKPRAFILENVQALTYNNQAGGPPFRQLLREIEDAGYSAKWAVLNAADYGVPQLRARLFVVGALRGLPIPDLPAPTHYGRWERRKASECGTLRLRHVTVREAFQGLDTQPEPGEVVTGRWASLLPEVPPGTNYLHFTDRKGYREPLFKWRSRYWSFLLKLDPDRPSPTIQARPGPYVGPFHWDNRRLRVLELKKLFTFPDTFEFFGSRSSVWSQIGNSVPPELARLVASSVLTATRK